MTRTNNLDDRIFAVVRHNAGQVKCELAQGMRAALALYRGHVKSHGFSKVAICATFPSVWKPDRVEIADELMTWEAE